MTELRELLFGDVPIESWAGALNEPSWTHFQDAEHAMARADVPAAEAALHAVLDTPDLESRQYLQAWTCLRQLDRDALTDSVCLVMTPAKDPSKWTAACGDDGGVVTAELPDGTTAKYLPMVTQGAPEGWTRLSDDVFVM